jgi:hypothetical protein
LCKGGECAPCGNVTCSESEVCCDDFGGGNCHPAGSTCCDRGGGCAPGSFCCVDPNPACGSAACCAAGQSCVPVLQNTRFCMGCV